MKIKELTSGDIIKNRVDTISQYKILKYLKDNLSILDFKLFLYDNETIKIIDKNDKIAYFKYQKETSEVIFYENEIEDKNNDFSM